DAAGVAPTPSPAEPTQVEGARLIQSASPQKVFVGQQIVASIELQTAIDLIEPQLPDLTYDGFLTRVIADNERTSRVIQGVPYDVVRFRRALYPLKAGELTLGARMLKTKVRARSKRGFPFNGLNPFDMDMDFFDRFFQGGTLKDVAIPSNEFRVQVQELPAWPSSAESWGLSQPVVGETTIEATLDKRHINVGESATLTVKITSTGNLSAIKTLPRIFPNQLKVYEEAPDVKEFESGGALMMQKTLRASVVPTAPGSIIIPAIALTYFDNAEGEYRTIEAPQTSLEVEGAAQQAVATPFQDLSKTAEPTETAPAATLRYEEETWATRLGRTVSISLAILILSSLAILAALSYAFVRTLRQKAPAKTLLRRLSLATELADIAQLFKQYVSLKTGVDLSVRGEPLRSSLQQSGLEPSLAFAIERVLDQLDAALYSGKQDQVDRYAIQQEAIATAQEL
ncbi:MAG: BatD family protein, partial [Oligoflexia bacterium]|nr:BatD family protein [Oligoflexia bacterium]